MAEQLVECYSGHTYAQEPRALTWQECRYRVVRVEARWRTPDGPSFRVQTEPDRRFEVHFCELEGIWVLQPLAEEDPAEIAPSAEISSGIKDKGQGGPDPK